MKLGRRWLYVLWIAAPVLWHQAGAFPSAFRPASPPQWDLSKTETPPPTADLTLQGACNLEDQSLDKKPATSPALLDGCSGIRLGDLIVVGAVRSDLPRCVSATAAAWHLARGPPDRA